MRFFPIPLILLSCILPLARTHGQTKQSSQPSAVLSKKGDSVTTSDGKLTIVNIEHKRGFGKDGYDPDIKSPKSAGFSIKGDKLYVNSLEGYKTVVYDGKTKDKIKTIHHNFKSGNGGLWLPPSGYYPFTHYPGGEKKAFSGKPVEQALSKDGKYLFVPYYRRNFDLNAQDPSALAVIDTRSDSIVLMTETGPLPKMVKVSHDGNLLAITHWGDNTVGFMDISSSNPREWKHLPPVTIGQKLKLNYSLSQPVNRDNGSGYALRGTVFLPGDSILLVGGMGGPTAVIDLKKMKWIGMIPELSTIRHIVLRGNTLYLSNNRTGEVLKVPVSSILEGIKESNGSTIHVSNIRKVKVGGGARTLEVTPDGDYIFVACNTASAVYIVNAEEMQVVGNIRADSYPVGLDISPSGTILVTTSQGRGGRGGNAVDLFRIIYNEPEIT